MIPVIILAGAVALGAVVLAKFWKEINEWISRIWKKLPPHVKEHLQGAKAFLERVEATVKNVFYYYSYNNETEKWTETVVSRQVDPESIPQDIREKMRERNNLEITDDVKQMLTVTA